MKSDFGIKRERSHLSLAIGSVLLLLIVGIIVWATTLQRENVPIKNLKNSTSKQTSAKVSAATSRWMFMGDIFFGRYIDDWSKASDLKEKYPFQRLHEFDRNQYNAWIANFECPAADGVNMTSAQMDQALSFNCPPRYLPEVAQWFTAVSLGNNHTDNQGVEAFKQTQQNLAKQGIQYFGAYDPRDHETVCNVVVLDFVIKYDSGQKIAGLPVGLCGYNAVFRIPTDQDIAVIIEYADTMPTFVMPHMGVEYKTGPDELRVTTYHKMIDAGAEMVIGNHPHYIQPTEAYKGKFIIYSMGNFIFDQQVRPEKTRSAMIDVRLHAQNAEAVDGWEKIAASCKNNFTECQRLAKSKNLPKLAFTYKFDMHGSEDSNKLVRSANESELQSIKQRLNWDATMHALGQ
mgnify:CR=1 FL=1